MRKIPFLPNKHFILNIGDDGAVLSLFDKNALVSKIYSQSQAIADRREIHATLIKNPDTPIYVLLDSMEQTYVKQTLPAVSQISIGKLVKRRMERDFAQTDIVGAVPFGRDTQGRNDWIYMFVSTPMTPLLTEWFEYLSTLENKITGIYLVPIEMETIINKINPHAFPDSANKKDWQLIVTHNKVSGFRQVILHHGRVVYTRLIKSEKGLIPDLVAGSIEQEILNTLDQIRRLGFGDNDEIDVIAVVAQDLKNSLSSSLIQGRSIVIYTPYELATILKYENIVEQDYKYTDILIARSFVNNNHILKLNNPKEKSADLLLILHRISAILTAFIIPIMLVQSIMLVLNTSQTKEQILGFKKQKEQISQRWQHVRDAEEYGAQDTNKIIDAVTLHNKLLTVYRTPISMLNKFAEIRHNFVFLQYFKWDYNKDFKNILDNAKVTSEIGITLNLEEDTPDSVFKSYDTMSQSLHSAFTNYTVNISDLPDVITFTKQNKDIPIKITLSSKNILGGK